MYKIIGLNQFRRFVLFCSKCLVPGVFVIRANRLFDCLFYHQEYKRLETLRQIKEADRRTEEMATRKEQMVNQRRKAALEVGMRGTKATLYYDMCTVDSNIICSAGRCTVCSTSPLSLSFFSDDGNTSVRLKRGASRRNMCHRG